MVEFYPEGILIDKAENAKFFKSLTALNEALYDEIGDIVLECDGDSLTIVEDYLEDLEEVTGTGR